MLRTTGDPRPSLCAGDFAGGTTAAALSVLEAMAVRAAFGEALERRTGAQGAEVSPSKCGGLERNRVVGWSDTQFTMCNGIRMLVAVPR